MLQRRMDIHLRHYVKLLHRSQHDEARIEVLFQHRYR
jgi:hypothetical protein